MDSLSFFARKSKNQDFQFKAVKKSGKCQDQTVISNKIGHFSKSSSSSKFSPKQSRQCFKLAVRSKSCTSLNAVMTTPRPQLGTMLDSALIKTHIQECSDKGIEDPWDPSALVTNLELIQAMEAIAMSLPKTVGLGTQVENISIIRMTAKLLQLTDKIEKKLMDDSNAVQAKEITSCIQNFEQFFVDINLKDFLSYNVNFNVVFKENDSLTWQLERHELKNIDNVYLSHVNLPTQVKKLMEQAAGRFIKAASAFRADANEQENIEELNQSVKDLKEAFMAAMGNQGLKYHNMWNEVMTYDTKKLFGIDPGF